MRWWVTWPRRSSLPRTDATGDGRGPVTGLNLIRWQLPMKPLLIFVSAMLLAVAADDKPTGRTAPLGYSDTPVIPGQKWKVHDIDRPRPKMVAPAAQPGQPPADAIVLFDGKDLSQWQNNRGGKVSPAKWKVGAGWVECVGGTGDLMSNEKFGDAQYHIEVGRTRGDRRHEPVGAGTAASW